MQNMDKPIQKFDDDLLYRKKFVRNFSESIINYHENDCLIVGIQGKWGSGKSSIINMVIDCINQRFNHEINYISDFLLDTNVPLFFHFNPWNFSNQENLILQFFIELENILNKDKNFTKETGEFLKRYALRITLDIAVIATAGNSLKDYMNKILEKSGIDEVLKEKGIYPIEEDSINDIKEKLKNSLSQLNKKIIIIIDDIDRLLNEEVKLIFQLVKSIADFPNIIYILSFDKENVVESLDNINVSNPEMFIEKIIQIPIDVPKISNDLIRELSFNELSKIFSNHSIECEYIEKDKINNNLVSFFNNLRDLKRYSNLLNFYLPLAKNELYVPDFCILLAIQIFDHGLFLDIKNNQALLTGVYGKNAFDKKEKDTPLLDLIINKKSKIGEEYKKKILANLFPKLEFAFDIGLNYDYEFMKEWRRNGRMCVDINFDKYFNFTIDNNDIALEKVNEILENINNAELFEKNLLLLSKEKKSHIFLEKLEDYTQDIPLENIPTIINSLMDIGDLLYEEYEGMFSHDNRMKILRVCYQLLQRFDTQEERFNIMKNAIINAERSIDTIISRVGVFDQEHGKYGLSKEPRKPMSERTINGSQLEELEELVLEKIQIWSKNGKLLKSKYFIGNIVIWSKIGKQKDIDDFIETTIKTTEGLIQLISCFQTKKSSMILNEGYERIQYHIDIETMKTKTNIDLIKIKIEEALKNENKLKKEEIGLLKQLLKELEKNSEKENN